MRSILSSRKFQESTVDLPIALGKTISNETYMFDLTKMPHILIVGNRTREVRGNQRGHYLFAL